MNQPIKAAIKGVASWVPDTKLTNFDLEKIVDTNDEWIRERTGIEERPILKLKETGSSYMGIRALNLLLEKTGLDPEEIDVLICTTVVPDYKFPPTSSIIVEGCGLKNAYCFDMNGTCSGFLYALDVATGFIVSGRYKKVVIVSAEKLSSMADYTDRASSILFGDGAGAVLLEPSDNEYGIEDTEMKASTSGAMNILYKGGGSVHPATVDTVENRWHYFWQDGKVVFKQAVMGMESVSRTVMERNGISGDDLKYVVPHQANKRIIDTIGKRMGVEDKMVVNIQKNGNMSTATIPLCLEVIEKELKPGDKLVLTAFGSGYTMGAVYLTWAY
ncbi:MAG: ketoacyl-ACP synthase III [Bacteroidetes bacterium]|nr:ketoacyl-ACP synthase III [Bacteroidota bacterium]